MSKSALLQRERVYLIHCDYALILCRSENVTFAVTTWAQFLNGTRWRWSAWWLRVNPSCEPIIFSYYFTLSNARRFYTRQGESTQWVKGFSTQELWFVQSYNTRNSSSYQSHACKTNTKQFAIPFQGPKIWNALPNDILKTKTLSYFWSRMLYSKFLLESSLI
jgi:hypothetical protein